jgi:hypothetical protein
MVYLVYRLLLCWAPRPYKPSIAATSLIADKAAIEREPCFCHIILCYVVMDGYFNSVQMPSMLVLSDFYFTAGSTPRYENAMG